MNDSRKFRIAIFASGRGTNAEAIMRYFDSHPVILVARVLCNNPKAGVIARTEVFGITVQVFNRQQLSGGEVLTSLREASITHVVLAGFLWLVPRNILDEFSGRIVNIHPALLPKFGGPGMYGKRVHEAVIAAKEKESGITIHEVNESFDEGRIVFQAKCKLDPSDTVESLAEKIHGLEHAHYPAIIEQWILEGAKN